MPFLNLRIHTELLIVDGTTAFTGGINIADENCIGLNPSDPVRDTHFRVIGPVVEQPVGAFTQSWLFATGEDLNGDRWHPGVASAGETMARAVTSGPDADLEKIERVVVHALNCAQHSIRLVTPYFLPSDVLATALSLAATRGVVVDVILPQASNHPFVDWTTQAHVGLLLW